MTNVLVSVMYFTGDSGYSKVWHGRHSEVLELEAWRPLIPSFILQEDLQNE